MRQLNATTMRPSSWQSSSEQLLLINMDGTSHFPGRVRAHMTEMERAGFGGVFIRIGDFGEKVNSQTPISYDEFRIALAPLAGLNAKTAVHNFAVYSQKVSVGFGIYDHPVDRAGMDVNLWGDTIVQALRRTDRYVCLYGESYDWWGTGCPTGRVPQAWLDVTPRGEGRKLQGALGSDRDSPSVWPAIAPASGGISVLRPAAVRRACSVHVTDAQRWCGRGGTYRRRSHARRGDPACGRRSPVPHGKARGSAGCAPDVTEGQ
jgi:hypothetical protein